MILNPKELETGINTAGNAEMMHMPQLQAINTILCIISLILFIIVLLKKRQDIKYVITWIIISILSSSCFIMMNTFGGLGMVDEEIAKAETKVHIVAALIWVILNIISIIYSIFKLLKPNKKTKEEINEDTRRDKKD